jgi:hypothetical protein
VPDLEEEDLEAMMRAPMRSFEPNQMQVRTHPLGSVRPGVRGRQTVGCWNIHRGSRKA